MYRGERRKQLSELLESDEGSEFGIWGLVIRIQGLEIRIPGLDM